MFPYFSTTGHKKGEAIVIIGAYAPSTDPESHIKDGFYEKLRDVLVNIGHTEEVCILGELNTKIGSRESSGKTWREHMLKHRSENYEHKEIPEFTWVINYLIQPQNTTLKKCRKGLLQYTKHIVITFEECNIIVVIIFREIFL